jgi:thioredoxin 1
MSDNPKSEFQIPKSNTPLLAFFSADWCEPCKWAEPVLDDVIKHFSGKISLHKIDVDEHPELAREHHVVSVPTLILFQNEKILWRMRGYDIAAELVKQLEEFV